MPSLIKTAHCSLVHLSTTISLYIYTSATHLAEHGGEESAVEAHGPLGAVDGLHGRAGVGEPPRLQVLLHVLRRHADQARALLDGERQRRAESARVSSRYSGVGMRLEPMSGVNESMTAVVYPSL